MSATVYLRFVQNLQSTRFCAVSSLAWFQYDYFLTLPREVKTFWHGKWTIPRILYLINRYLYLAKAIHEIFVVFYPLSYSACKASIIAQRILGVVHPAALQAVLIYRMKAVYNRRLITLLLVFLFIASNATTIAIALIVGIGVHVKTEPLPGIKLCSVTGTYGVASRIASFNWVFLIPFLICETVLFVLAAHQLHHSFAIVRKQTMLFRRPVYVLELILRDSIWYFILLLVITPISLILQHENQSEAYNWLTIYSESAFAIIGVRLCLNLQEYLSQPVRGDDSTSATMSGISFAKRPAMTVDSIDFQLTTVTVKNESMITRLETVYEGDSETTLRSR